MSRWTAPVSALMRRPQAASPVPLVPRYTRTNLLSYMATHGVLGYLEAYGNDPVIRPIVARNVQAVSEAQWHLYVKSPTGNKQDRTEVTSHALLDFLDKPNAFQSLNEIVARGQQHWELAGETSIVLGFLPGVKLPLDMWVLRPDRIMPVPDPYEFLAGWIYTTPGDSEKIPLSTAELMRMVDPDPTDPYRGMGAVQALMRDLDASQLTKEWQAAFFQNSAQPGGVIQVDHRMDDTEFREMNERWAEQHKGVSKAHRVAMLENGATWVQNSFSLKDLQMAELESLGRDKILAAFGMPKSIIGVVEDVNRANAEAGEYLFARWMTRPRLVHWRSMFNTQLVPFFDPRGVLELDFDDPVPENSEANIAELNTKAGVVVQLVGAGFDAAEVLEFVDWPELAYTRPAVATHSTQDPSKQGSTTPAEVDRLPHDPGTDLRSVREIDNAMRWKVVGHPDNNCCDPCKEKIGTLYRNRSSAYADYPPGRGYIKCVGAQYGNHCRCKVVKRRNGR